MFIPEDSPSGGKRLAKYGFRLSTLGWLVTQSLAEVIKSGRHTGGHTSQPFPFDAKGLSMHCLRLVHFSKLPKDDANRVTQLDLNFRLVFKFSANARDGGVEDLAQHGGVASEGH